MAVYMIRCGQTDAVKIGKADDVGARLASLQCGHHETLSLIREFEGGRREERWLHKRFAEFRVRAEWFRLTPEMLTIELPASDDMADDLAPPPEPVREISPIAALIESFPEGALAAGLRVKQGHIAVWKHRNSIPSTYWRRIINTAVRHGLTHVTADALIDLHSLPALAKISGPAMPCQIIDALGGTKAVAAGLGCSMPVVSNWRSAKIPAERWAQLVAAFPKEISFEALAAQLPSGASA